MIEFDQAKVTAILIAHGGWQTIQQGTLTIARLELGDEASEAENYGYEARIPDGGYIIGRLSSLLAVKL